MQGLFGLVTDEIQKGNISRDILAVEGWTGIQNKLGNRHPLVAALDNAAFQYAMSLLTTQQGARSISDRDVINYLALAPTIREVALAPDTAVMKIMQIRSQLVSQILADSDPELRKVLSRSSRLAPTSMERKIAARAKLLVDQFNKAQSGGDIETANGIATEIMDLGKTAREAAPMTPGAEEFIRRHGEE
jgi:hypothetical protein